MNPDKNLLKIAIAYFPDYVSSEIKKLSESKNYYAEAGVEYLSYHFDECGSLIDELSSSSFITLHLSGILHNALVINDDSQVREILQYCREAVKYKPDLYSVIGAAIYTQIPHRFGKF